MEGDRAHFERMRYFILAALFCAGCSATSPRPYPSAAYPMVPPPPPVRLQTPAEMGFGQQRYTPAPRMTWCRPDGFGGTYCS